MTRIERIAPLLNELSDEEFEELLAAASYAVGDTKIYDTLPAAERAEIDAAKARLDAGEGVAYADVKAVLKAKLKSAGA